MYNEKFWRETIATATIKTNDPIKQGHMAQTAKQLAPDQKKDLRGKFLALYFAMAWRYGLDGKTISAASDLAFSHIKTIFSAMQKKEPLNPAVYELNRLVDDEIKKSQDPNRIRYDFIAPWVIQATPEQIAQSKAETDKSIAKCRGQINEITLRFKFTENINPAMMQALAQRQKAA